MNIENENQNPESNLKMENENQNPKWDFDHVIWWLYENDYCFEAIKMLTGFIKEDMNRIKMDRANYRNTLKLVSKITKDQLVKDIVNDTINGE